MFFSINTYAATNYFVINQDWNGVISVGLMSACPTFHKVHNLGINDTQYFFYNQSIWFAMPIKNYTLNTGGNTFNICIPGVPDTVKLTPPEKYSSACTTYGSTPTTETTLVKDAAPTVLNMCVNNSGGYAKSWSLLLPDGMFLVQSAESYFTEFIGMLNQKLYAVAVQYNSVYGDYANYRPYHLTLTPSLNNTFLNGTLYDTTNQTFSAISLGSVVGEGSNSGIYMYKVGF